MNKEGVLTISQACLNSQYRGCGKAWAAIKNGEVVALRYMGNIPIPGYGPTPIPQWVKAVMDNADGLDDYNLPTTHSSKCLVKIAEACEGTGDCPTRRPRGGRYRPKELLMMARDILATIHGAEFSTYRSNCRTELAEIGEVMSGMCSCTKFVLQ